MAGGIDDEEERLFSLEAYDITSNGILLEKNKCSNKFLMQSGNHWLQWARHVYMLVLRLSAESCMVMKDQT